MVDEKDMEEKATARDEKDKLSEGSQEGNHSEEEQGRSKGKQTAWIYQLSKSELQDRLAEFFVSISDDATFEELRKL